VGAALIALGEDGAGSYPNPALGNTLALGAAFLVSIYLLIGRAVRQRTSFLAYFAPLNAVAPGVVTNKQFTKALGRVLRRLAEPRELVTPGQPILDVSRGGDGWTLRLGVPDRDFVRLHDGDAASLRFDAHPGRSFAGRVSLLGGAADPRSGVFPVEIAFDAGDARFAAGMIGRAEIAAGNGGDQRSYVPLSALVEGNGDAMLLFVHEGGSVAARRVPVAFVSGTHAVLAESLPEGTQVVTDGAPYLRDGEAVRVVN
jgi:RND family efflux transporter MFP subunit